MASKERTSRGGVFEKASRPSGAGCHRAVRKWKEMRSLRLSSRSGRWVAVAVVVVCYTPRVANERKKVGWMEARRSWERATG